MQHIHTEKSIYAPDVELVPLVSAVGEFYIENVKNGWATNGGFNIANLPTIIKAMRAVLKGAYLVNPNQMLTSNTALKESAQKVKNAYIHRMSTFDQYFPRDAEQVIGLTKSAPLQGALTATLQQEAEKVLLLLQETANTHLAGVALGKIKGQYGESSIFLMQSPENDNPLEASDLNNLYLYKKNDHSQRFIIS